MPSLIESRSPINAGWFDYSNHGGNLLLTWLCSLVHHLQYGTRWNFLCVSFTTHHEFCLLWNINAPDTRVKCESLRYVPLFVTPWTVACHAPLSMEFSRQESWSGYPFPSPGDLPDPEMEIRSLTLQADSLPSEPPGKPIGRQLWQF